jgi:hypothetical protein
MPFRKTRARIKNAAARLRAGTAAHVAAGKQWLGAAAAWTARTANSLKRAAVRHIGTGVRHASALARSAIATWTVANALIARQVSIASAYTHRYYFLTFYFTAIAGLSVLCWIFWGNPAITGLLKEQGTDTPHANFYYAVTIIFLPLQTVLLLVGGLYAWRALSQNLRFKQHEVEASCVRDYVAVEQRLELAAGDGEKVKGAVRAYWTLIVYEYYWWRRGLVSRELHVQKFHDNPPYTFARATTPPPFTNFREGFEYCKVSKVFRHPSLFEDLMNYLIRRADGDLENLQWHNIERYRRGWRRHF